MKRNLRLRKEALAELEPAQLTSVAAAQEIGVHTVTVCISHVCPVLKAVGGLVATLQSGQFCTTEC